MRKYKIDPDQLSDLDFIIHTKLLVLQDEKEKELMKKMKK